MCWTKLLDSCVGGKYYLLTLTVYFLNPRDLLLESSTRGKQKGLR